MVYSTINQLIKPYGELGATPCLTPLADCSMYQRCTGHDAVIYGIKAFSWLHPITFSYEPPTKIFSLIHSWFHKNGSIAHGMFCFWPLAIYASYSRDQSNYKKWCIKNEPVAYLYKCVDVFDPTKSYISHNISISTFCIMIEQSMNCKKVSKICVELKTTMAITGHTAAWIILSRGLHHLGWSTGMQPKWRLQVCFQQVAWEWRRIKPCEGCTLPRKSADCP